MSPSTPRSSDSPHGRASTTPWPLASTIACLTFGICSVFFLGVFFFGVYVERLLPGWFYVASVVCGVIGVVFGHLARARRAAAGSRNATLAMAGLVLSYGGLLLPLGFVALVFVALLLEPIAVFN